MKRITENIFEFKYEAKIMPGVSFPVRTVFFELEGNELLIVSPGPFGEREIREFVGRYSKVYCLAPNGFHYLHLNSFHKTFPEVEIFGPSNIKKKQPGLSDIIKSTAELTERLSGQLDFYPIDGNELLSEVAIYCPHSKSLIVTDLIFNMRDPMPIGRKILLKLVGAHNKAAQSRLIKASTKNKSLYLESIEKLIELEVENLVMSHGNPIKNSVEIKRVLGDLG